MIRWFNTNEILMESKIGCLYIELYWSYCQKRDKIVQFISKYWNICKLLVQIYIVAEIQFRHISNLKFH